MNTESDENCDVTDVRRSLYNIRKAWSMATTEAPFFISDDLVGDMSVSRFAFKFVLGHHVKRPQK